MNGRKVDIRTAEPKVSEKIAHINKSVQDLDDRRNGRGNRGGDRRSRERANNRGNRSRSRSYRDRNERKGIDNGNRGESRQADQVKIKREEDASYGGGSRHSNS